MKPFTALLLNTFQKEYRNKVLIFLSLLTIVVLFLLNAGLDFVARQAQTQSDAGDLVKFKLGYFYSIIGIWSGLLAGLLGVNCVRSDFEHRMIAQILSFPIRRFEYLIARILGSWLLIVIYYLISIALALIYFSYQSKSFSFEWRILGALGVSSLSMLVYVVLGALLSLFMPKLLAFLTLLLTGLFMNISNWYYKYIAFSESFKELNFFKGIGLFFHNALPRVGVVNDLADLVQGPTRVESYNFWKGTLFVKKTVLGAISTGDIAKLNVWVEAGHFAITFAILAALLYLVFRRTDPEL
ncbi:MAG: ABC transporter permease subunit [Spirochaetia bacterium]|nr:ABC transporter permease subunit [Spirochaetia bacterium]